MEHTLQLILEQLQKLNDRVGGLEEGQQSLLARQIALEERQISLEEGQQSIQKDIKELKDITTRIEGKQELIYEHTARLSEYHTEVKNEIKGIKSTEQQQEQTIDLLCRRSIDMEAKIRYLKH